jgi:hypothetical protein
MPGYSLIGALSETELPVAIKPESSSPEEPAEGPKRRK